MQLRPLFLIRGHRHDRHDGSGDPGVAVADYRAYSDDQLVAERDRQQRRLDELTRQQGHPSATCSQLVSLDADVEQMTDELIRRARSRHPSSRGLAG